MDSQNGFLRTLNDFSINHESKSDSTQTIESSITIPESFKTIKAFNSECIKNINCKNDIIPHIIPPKLTQSTPPKIRNNSVEKTAKYLEQRLAANAKAYAKRHFENFEGDSNWSRAFATISTALKGVDETFAGFIAKEGESRINSESVYLQQSHTFSDGSKIKLDLSSLNTKEAILLFPGQVVVVKGFLKDELKQSLSVKEVITDFSFKGSVPLKAPKKIQSDFAFFVAAGVFTAPNAVDYSGSALQRFAKVLNAEKPSAALLIGPFVAEYSLKDDSPPFSRLFQQIYAELISGFIRDIKPLLSRGFKLFIIGSSEDLVSSPVIPNFPSCVSLSSFGSDVQNSVFFLPSSCQFNIGGLKIQLCATDIIFDLLRSDLKINKSSVSKSRWVELSEQLVKQKSAYPLYPPLNASVDFMETVMEGEPDLILWTSPSTKVSHRIAGAFELFRGETLSVYPGHLLGRSGSRGCFSKIYVSSRESKNTAGCVGVQIEGFD